MISKNNRALLYYVKLCPSFQIHWWIQTGVTVQKRSIRVEFGDITFRLTLKFDVWPWKTIGHLFYTTSSFVHHFKPSVKSNLSYSPETLNSGQNWWFFVLRDLEIWWMTLKNNTAPLLCCFKLCVSFHSHCWIEAGVTVRKRPIWVKNRRFFLPFDLQIWWMTLKNKKAPLLCSFKLCVSFHSHWWIQAGVTVRKRPIWVKIDNYFSRVTLIFDGWPWKTIKGTSSKQHQALCIISLTYVNSDWSYVPETAKWGHDLCDLDLWPLTLTCCMVITSVNGNNSW